MAIIKLFMCKSVQEAEFIIKIDDNVDYCTLVSKIHNEQAKIPP